MPNRTKLTKKVLFQESKFVLINLLYSLINRLLLGHTFEN